MKKIGYLRVSTNEQKPDRQIDGLKNICDEIHIEKLSATAKKRPVFKKVIRKLKPGDTLVVWDLDRAFRSTIDALLEANKLRKRGVEFQIVTMHLDTSTPEGEYVYTIMAAQGQLERRYLSKRTKEGMEAARRRGKRLGRPPLFDDKDLRKAHAKVTTGKATIETLALELGCCRDTLPKAFKRIGLEV